MTKSSGRLRVLLFGRARHDTAERHCATALREMGHEVVLFDPDAEPFDLSAYTQHPRLGRLARRAVDGRLVDRLRMKRLVESARRLRPDLVLVLAINRVSPAAVTQIDALGVPVVGWFQDHIVNFERQLFLLAPYRALFFKDPHIVERLRRGAGLEHVHFLPEACEPSCHRPLEPTDEDRRVFGCDVLIYGNLYPYRAKILESLEGLDVKFFGQQPPLWMNHPCRRWWAGRALELDDKARALGCAKIVVSTSHFGEVRSANARIFETAGIGAFQLADAPGASDFFIPGEEIVLFEGPNNLRALVEHYLPREEDRSRIARAGRARAHRDHTFRQRLERLIEVSGVMPSMARSS